MGTQRSWSDGGGIPRRNLHDALQGFHDFFIKTYSFPGKRTRRVGRSHVVDAERWSGEISPGSSASPRRNQTKGSPKKAAEHLARYVEDPCPHWTCRMVRNLPNDYTRKDLTSL